MCLQNVLEHDKLTTSISLLTRSFYVFMSETACMFFRLRCSFLYVYVHYSLKFTSVLTANPLRLGLVPIHFVNRRHTDVQPDHVSSTVLGR